MSIYTSPEAFDQTTDDTTEVPDWIDEWPEDDTALRSHQWRDLDDDVWYAEDDSDNPWGVRLEDRADSFHPYPQRGPWTRVEDE